MGKQSLLMQLHQKNQNLVSLESTLIPNIQILCSVCTPRNANNGNTDHKNIFSHAVYLYHFLFPFITVAKSAAFCKNRIEGPASLWDITKLSAVIPHRRFGTIYPILYSRVNTFLEILTLEGGIDRKNLCAELSKRRRAFCVQGGVTYNLE